MAPSSLPVVIRVMLVSKRDVGDVALAHKFLDEFGDCRLRFSLREIVRDECSTDP